MNYQIIPGILEESQSRFQQKFNIASTLAPVVQIDIIDKSFSTQLVNPDLGFTKKYPTQLELHLMTQNPDEWVESYQHLNIKRIIGHVEFMQNTSRFISTVKSLGFDPFLGIDLNTPIEEYLRKDLLSQGIKGFLVMTVKAGKSGQKFDPAALSKTKKLRRFFPEIDIEIDGGVNPQTLHQALSSGVNLFAATSAIFTDNPQESYNTLKSLLHK